MHSTGRRKRLDGESGSSSEIGRFEGLKHEQQQEEEEEEEEEQIRDAGCGEAIEDLNFALSKLKRNNSRMNGSQAAIANIIPNKSNNRLQEESVIGQGPNLSIPLNLDKALSTHSHPRKNPYCSMVKTEVSLSMSDDRKVFLPISSSSITSSVSSPSNTYPSAAQDMPSPAITENSSTSLSAPSSISKPKRRKTTRSCTSCAKSKVACEEARPCSRCIKRGLSSSCVDTPITCRKQPAQSRAQACAGCPRRRLLLPKSSQSENPTTSTPNVASSTPLIDVAFDFSSHLASLNCPILMNAQSALGPSPFTESWPQILPQNNTMNNPGVQFNFTGMGPDMCSTPCEPFFTALMSQQECLLSSMDSESSMSIHRDLSTVSLTQALALDDHDSMLLDLHAVDGDTGGEEVNEGTKARLFNDDELMGGFVCPYMGLDGVGDGDGGGGRREGPCDDCPMSRKFDLY
jgi:hypothetical protein